MNNNSNMDKLRAELKSQMDEAYRIARQLEKAYDALNPDAPKGGKYFRLRVWQALRAYLRTVGGEASVNEIEDALVREGCELGKYPRRTVKNAVCSPYTLNRIFRLDHTGNDETVILIEKSPSSDEAPIPVKRRGKSSPQLT